MVHEEIRDNIKYTYLPTAQEFVSALAPWSQWLESPSINSWIFRGHVKKEWPLLPSAFRSQNSLNKFIPSFCNTNHDQIRLESKTLLTFFEIADVCGITLPEDSQRLRIRIEKIQRDTSPSNRRGENKGLNLIRYADDFVVTAPSKERIVSYVLPKLRVFLKERGMELNEAKTKIIHRNDGFNFLGFIICQYSNRIRSVCLAKPSKNAIKRHLEHIKIVISTNKQMKADELISKLNPIIRGWANYYCYSSAKETFNYIDYRIWKMLWRWCLRRHTDKGKQWIRHRYFMNISKRTWIFGERKDNVLLFSRSFRAGVKYTPIKGYNSPYDANLHEYWSKQHGKSWRETTPM